VSGVEFEGQRDRAGDTGHLLFISPRTVQTHLTHVYTKLGLSSRVQLVQEAARHN
jgi:DNA-binding CsgD family transcriptional regulator